MAKGAAKGTTFTIGTTIVGGITSIGGVAISADTLDATDLSSADGYREFMQGWKDGGEVSLSGHLDAANAGQDAIMTALNAGTAVSCIITFPTAMSTSWTFDGIVIGAETGAELEDLVSFDATVKVTGKPVLA